MIEVVIVAAGYNDPLHSWPARLTDSILEITVDVPSLFLLI